MSENAQIPVLRYLYNREYDPSKWSDNIFSSQRLSKAPNLFRKDLQAHFGCVNAIEFSNGGEWLASGGDDRRILLWNVGKAINGIETPVVMRGEHGSNIFCIGLDSNNQKIYSSGNDELVIVHDANTRETVDVFLHEDAVYGLSVDPLNDNVFASACDDGRILVWDIRQKNSSGAFCLASYNAAFHAVMYNPVESRLLATANSKEGVGLWDVRMPKICLLRFGASPHQQSCMSVRFNRQGTHVLALRRRLPPVLYDIHSPTTACEFDNPGYYNSCTMKSCCFAGDKDQYVVSGSDDFNLYLWQIPKENNESTWVDEAHLVLRGHRSVANQVRFNHNNFVFASSGVEKVIKLWSPFEFSGPSSGSAKSLPSLDNERTVYSHEDYISLVLRSGQVMSHDYTLQSTEEDPKMLAFFDSLVQREMEASTSDTSIASSVLSRPNNSDSERLEAEPNSQGDSFQASLLSLLYASTAGSTISSNSVTNNSDSIASNVPQDQDLISVNAPNRISELIAQKRSHNIEAANRKSVKNKISKRRKRAKKLESIFAVSSINNDTCSDSEESGTEVGESPLASTPRKVSFTLNPSSNERRVSSRKRRAKMSNYSHSSDSDDDEITPKKPNHPKEDKVRSCSCNNINIQLPTTSSSENTRKCKLCFVDKNVDNISDEDDYIDEDAVERNATESDVALHYGEVINESRSSSAINANNSSESAINGNGSSSSAIGANSSSSSAINADSSSSSPISADSSSSSAINANSSSSSAINGNSSSSSTINANSSFSSAQNGEITNDSSCSCANNPENGSSCANNPESSSSSVIIGESDSCVADSAATLDSGCLHLRIKNI